MVAGYSHEGLLIWTGIASYSAALSTQWIGALSQRVNTRLAVIWLGIGVAIFALAITERWLRLGYGPFLTLYEILLSNLFSLGLVYSLLYWKLPAVRPGALIALPLLLLIGIWITTVSPAPSPLPATYDNPWLWVHVSIGKLFLGAALAAVGIAGLLLLRRLPVCAGVVADAGVETLDAVVWRLMAAAFIFHSLMLVAGAVWAQDAWGRFWAWDPLETWAFITWLVLGITLHARVTYKIPHWLGWSMVIVVFVLAFLTFFGVPFVSQAPHKGVL